MAMWRKRTILGVASLAATGLIALALFAIGGGASGTSASGATAKRANTRTGPPTPAERQARQEEMAAAIAGKPGELTPQQAARIKSCMNGGSCPRPHWLRGGPRRFRGGPHMGFRFGPPPMGGPPPGDMGPP